MCMYLESIAYSLLRILEAPRASLSALYMYVNIIIIIIIIIINNKYSKLARPGFHGAD